MTPHELQQLVNHLIENSKVSVSDAARFARASNETVAKWRKGIHLRNIACFLSFCEGLGSTVTVVKDPSPELQFKKKSKLRPYFGIW